ncbi:thymidylate kinase [Methanocella sp. CWC-04]|uniref:dTMP kinase n=1 Tax=Methanooceanicella nereidis TaxID=2052831 RepID=A0AAP2W6W8_9EURY|nr:thymidylate kinase [Methanocella sp. CWC-04]MCD1294674.1 thymidylate kinase [Methanocella sp. CWC-04]
MRFIVIDGLDGSGKDTQAYRLKDHLSNNGSEVVLRIHPSQDNFFGKFSKKSLTRGGKFDRMLATLFYGFDVIRSILLYCRGDRTVIFVRYTMACAYLPKAIIRPVYKIVKTILPHSEEMFFLDVSPEEALRRVHSRGGELEMFETLPHMEKVRSRAMMIVDDWKVVDGNPAPDKVFENIVNSLKIKRTG